MERKKNVNFFRWLNNLAHIFKYWSMFIIGPVLVALAVGKIYHFHYNAPSMILLAMGALFILFVAPFLFYFPYKRAKLNNVVERIIFISGGLAIPYIFIYIYLYEYIYNIFTHFYISF